MKQIENECLGCTSFGLPCKGSSCSNKHVARFYCDNCGAEETLYNFDDEELCLSCIIEKLEIVEGSNY